MNLTAYRSSSGYRPEGFVGEAERQQNRRQHCDDEEMDASTHCRDGPFGGSVAWTAPAGVM